MHPILRSRENGWTGEAVSLGKPARSEFTNKRLEVAYTRDGMRKWGEMINRAIENPVQHEPIPQRVWHQESKCQRHWHRDSGGGEQLGYPRFLQCNSFHASYFNTKRPKTKMPDPLMGLAFLLILQEKQTS